MGLEQEEQTWLTSLTAIDIMQQSGTCPTGINTCSGYINADFDSENATVNIVQKDTTD